jgi:hypothetical protein
MDEIQGEDWLEARLREEMPYIDDGGFTARLMENLPARSPRRSFRGAILLCLTLLASAVTYTVSDGGQFVVTALRDLAAMPLLYICVIAILCTLLLTGIAVGAAVVQTREKTFG